MSASEENPARTVLFISKATPTEDVGDNEFALWLAPRLEAAGYETFADILSLDSGSRWRKEITNTLQNRAIKILLCCSNDTLGRDNVQEEVGIGLDLAKQLGDPKFIIPLRKEAYKKLLGIGELQYVDFTRGWAEGLDKLFDQLQRQKIKPNPDKVTINPHWEIFRRRSAIPLLNEPERLTSNWIRVAECPDTIRYLEASGAVDPDALAKVCNKLPFPVVARERGLYTFATLGEINEALSETARFAEKYSFALPEFLSRGAPALNLKGRDSTNIVHAMYRMAWQNYCRARGFLEYFYSNATSGFHVSADLAALGQRIPWGTQGEKRSSMLRNTAKGHVWQFGVTGVPTFWPFQHFKLKSRVLFAPPQGGDAGEPYDNSDKQHRLRRSMCKGWRNKQWHGRIRAFIELLAGESAFIVLKLGPSASVLLDASPMLFTSPVSTPLPNVMAEDDEENDESTLGRPVIDPDEDEKP